MELKTAILEGKVTFAKGLTDTFQVVAKKINDRWLYMPGWNSVLVATAERNGAIKACRRNKEGIFELLMKGCQNPP